jgi:prepilin-type N-terminal cleavage/methylation domain-containing protein
MSRSCRNRSGFSFVEILCVLLILTVGLLSAVSLLRQGVRLAQDAQATALAYPTARTLLYCAKPLGVDPSEWTRSGSVWQGYVNGVWAKRTILNQDTVGDTTYATIKVEVFWSDSSGRALALQERIAYRAP